MNGIVGRPTGVRKLIVLKRYHIFDEKTPWISCLEGKRLTIKKKKKKRTNNLIKNALDGNSLGVQWLRLRAFAQSLGVQLLVREPRSCKPCGMANEKRKMDWT